MLQNGKLDSELVSVGMVAIVVIANLVGVEISSHAAMHK
jgi:hypothetical protein